MDPKAERVRAPQDIIIEELEGLRGRGAKAGGELLDQFRASAALRPQQYREFLLVIRRLESIEFRNQFAQRLIPGNFFELTLTTCARAFERVPDAIGVIGDLGRRLSARAKFSAVDRMIGIAFQLFRQAHSGEAQLSVAQDLHLTVHDACDQPAARRTKRTNAGPPYRGARHDPVFGNETNEMIFGIAAAGERRAGSGEAGNFDELAPIHIF